MQTTDGNKETAIAEVEQQLLWAHGPAERLRALVDALDRLARSQPSYALGLAAEGYRLSQQLGDHAAAANVLLHRGTACAMLGMIDTATADLQAAMEMFGELDRPADVARAALASAAAAAAGGRIAEAHELYTAALGSAPPESAERRAVLRDLGSLRGRIGDTAAALEFLHTCLAEEERARDDGGRAGTLAEMGLLYARAGDAARARDCLDRGAELGRSAGNHGAELAAICARAELALEDGRAADAFEPAFRAMAIQDAAGDVAGLAGTFCLIARAHLRSGEAERACDAARRALELAHAVGSDSACARASIELARSLAALGRLGDADFMLENASALARASGDPALAAEAHRELADACERAARPGRALEHLRRFIELREQIAGIDQRRALRAAEDRFAIAGAERERERLQQHTTELEAELEAGQQELAGMATIMLNRRTLLDALRRDLVALRSAAPDADTRQAAIDRMLATINANLHAADDWAAFEQRLGAAHGEFVGRLLARCPELTQAEVRVCSLARLNLSTKEMAQLLFASVRTIHTHRHNIRRKLGLGSDANLTSALAAM